MESCEIQSINVVIYRYCLSSVIWSMYDIRGLSDRTQLNEFHGVDDYTYLKHL